VHCYNDGGGGGGSGVFIALPLCVSLLMPPVDGDCGGCMVSLRQSSSCCGLTAASVATRVVGETATTSSSTTTITLETEAQAIDETTKTFKISTDREGCCWLTKAASSSLIVVAVYGRSSRLRAADPGAAGTGTAAAAVLGDDDGDQQHHTNFEDLVSSPQCLPLSRR